jgi:hypothetical protein
VTSADEDAVVSRVSGLLRPLSHLTDPGRIAFRPGHWLLVVAAMGEAVRAEALDAYAALRWESSADDADFNPLSSELIADIRALVHPESEAGGGS